MGIFTYGSTFSRMDWFSHVCFLTHELLHVWVYFVTHGLALSRMTSHAWAFSRMGLLFHAWIVLSHVCFLTNGPVHVWVYFLTHGLALSLMISSFTYVGLLFHAWIGSLTCAFSRMVFFTYGYTFSRMDWLSHVCFVMVPSRMLSSRNGAVWRAAHGDRFLLSHSGFDPSMVSMAHSFYWPWLCADVALSVCLCFTCAALKSGNHQWLGFLQCSAIPVQLFTSWAMTMIGPLPTTQLGNNWIVTWIDQTTKTIVAAAAAAPTSKKTLTRLTFWEICCCFELPLNLTMDNDMWLNNRLWENLWKMCNSKLKFTSSYHPQADPAEKVNWQVMESLRAVVATVAQYDEWDLALPHITFGLNTHARCQYHH